MKYSTIFGFLALTILFFKLPGVSEVFGFWECKSCNTNTPYLPMLAAAYMTALLTCILCFPTLPSPSIKQAGLIWSFALAFGLTYLNPVWCVICLIGHGCHIGMWTFWKPSRQGLEEMVGMKLSLIFTSAMAVVALYSTLQFTFLVYGLKVRSPLDSLVKAGMAVKNFDLETVARKELSSEKLSSYDGIILNFISESCPYCREQIPLLDKIAGEFAQEHFRFVNVSRSVISDLQLLGPRLEWVEDHQGDLFTSFGITGYPTMVLVDPNGVVLDTQAGLPSDFESKLKSRLNVLCIRQPRS